MKENNNLQKAAWEVWEEDQKTNPTPVNPHAFVYGFRLGANWQEQQLVSSESKPPEWYTESGMYNYLLNQKYSEEIAKELSKLFADVLQGAFKKGWEKGYNDFNPNSNTFTYKYYNPEQQQVSGCVFKDGLPINPGDYFCKILATGGKSVLFFNGKKFPDWLTDKDRNSIQWLDESQSNND